MAAGALASDAAAQRVDPALWTANGQVYAQAVSGNTLFLGGTFTRLGPYTGGGVPIDSASGNPVAGFPRVRGIVRAAIPDGQGGWFVGGVFDSVGGLFRRNLARIHADLSVASWSPQPDADVYALALGPGTLFVGGGFTTIGGQTRNRVAAFDLVTGAATAWNPNANGAVRTLAPSGSSILAGGEFTTIGGQPRAYLAALDATSGLATAWNPGASFWVQAIEVSGTTVYVGGNFTSIGGQARNRVAALDLTSGAVLAWNPDADNSVVDFEIAGTNVYVCGGFTNIGGRARHGLAELRANNGSATNWDPGPQEGEGSTGRVYRMLLRGSTLYVGGDFIGIGGQPRVDLAALDLVSGAATAWNPDPEGGLAYAPQVYALAAGAGRVYAGGSIKMVGGVRRNYLGALDLTTGAATAWNPNADFWVRALAVDGSKVYAGGNFYTIGGQPRQHLAALDLVSGAATAWNPDVGGDILASVQTLVVSGGTVYIGGSFNSVGGASRNRIAAVDATTGLATAWNPGANLDVHVLALGPGTVYAGGIFGTIGGQSRPMLAALDATTGLATAWNPQPNVTLDSRIDALAVAGSVVYVGGTFQQIGGQIRFNLAALDAGTGLATSWNPGAGSNVSALAVAGGVVFAGGYFSTIGGAFRPRIAAIDAGTALATDWSAGANAQVLSVVASGYRVLAGGAFTDIGGVPATGVAAILDLASVGVAPAAARASLALELSPNPVRDRAALRFVLPGPATVSADLLDTGGRRVRPLVEGAFAAGAHEIGLRRGRLASGLYLVRLRAAGITVARKMIVLD